jgi:hypothetical protein
VTGEGLLAFRNLNGDAEFFTQRKFEIDSLNIISKEDLDIPTFLRRKAD